MSATENDFYAMPLPFSVYSWCKIGFLPIVFIPHGINPKLNLAKQYCKAHFIEFECENNKIPTYSQVIRHFGSAVQRTWQLGYNVMITTDCDMAVFGDFFASLNDGQIHVIGHDLTPEDQYPMCFCAMPVMMWSKVMNIGEKSAQDCVSELVEPIQSSNLKGDAWSFDQWYLKKQLDPYKDKIIFHSRTNGENQFAKNRADRDGWSFDPFSIMDAHLPRPLSDQNNFQKVMDLFKIKYPEDNLSWIEEFYNEYLKLL